MLDLIYGLFAEILGKLNLDIAGQYATECLMCFIASHAEYIIKHIAMQLQFELKYIFT